MLLGSAVIVAIGVGAVAGGAGGGGGAGFFLWHPATVSIAARLTAITRDVRFEIFTCLSSFRERFGGFYQGKKEFQLPTTACRL
jgi:hypothetical protein